MKVSNGSRHEKPRSVLIFGIAKMKRYTPREGRLTL
jgi:hypothetical protein